MTTLRWGLGSGFSCDNKEEDGYFIDSFIDFIDSTVALR